jgi:hypothetical protein
MNVNERNGVQSTIIANPIYGTAFEKLMENMRIAKYFLSTVLSLQITDIAALSPHEFPCKNKDEDLADIWFLFNGYFTATVKTKDGKTEKILIEVRKSWESGYIKQIRKRFDKLYPIGSETTFHTAAIYVRRTEAKSQNPCINIRWTCADVPNTKTVNMKFDFMELFIHDCHTLRTDGITDTTNLDKLLSIFEQSNFILDNSTILKGYSYQQDDEEIGLIASVLEKIAAHSKERNSMKNEEEGIRFFHDRYGFKFKMFEEPSEPIKENDKLKEEQDRLLKKQNKLIREMYKFIKERSKSLKEWDESCDEQLEAFGERIKVLKEQIKQIYQCEPIE